MTRFTVYGFRVLWLIFMGLSISACDDQQQTSTSDPNEMEQDQSIIPDRGTMIMDRQVPSLNDMQSLMDMMQDQELMVDQDTRPTGPVTQVIIDDALFPTAAVDHGYVRVFRSEAESDLLDSETRLAKVGDYVLENEHVRFIVEDDDRVIGPCPYGGNIIDAAPRELELGDQIGEVCLLVNIAQTLKPERYDIIEDGSNGRAILAVTGHLELLDFINIKGFATAFLPDSLQLGFDTDTLLPLGVTIYYVLTPQATGVRVLSALRNDSTTAVHFPIGHLIDSGGEVTTFSPYNAGKSFGAPNLSPADINIGPTLFALGFQGAKGSYVYAPDGLDDLRSNRPFPVAGTYLTISGVSVSLLGTQNVLSTLLTAPGALPTAMGFQHLEPQEHTVIGHWHWVGNRSLASSFDPVWSQLNEQEDVALTEIQGTVAVQNNDLSMTRTVLEGVRVTAIDERDQTLNQAISDAEGKFHMRLPSQITYRVRAWKVGHGSEEQILDAESDTHMLDFTLNPAAYVRVRVRDVQENPVPAKVTFLCDPSPCEHRPLANEFDARQDYWTDGIAHVALLDMSGEDDVMLHPGQYKVVVSRGPTWSVWPSLEGYSITLSAGENPVIEAAIDEVVHHPGWISGDFHVHGINSPDAPVSLQRRVLSFLSEGVDVLVSTDHDYITDYTPTIQSLNAETHLATMIGEELTTFDYGHYNGFPLTRDPDARNGGAWDWAGGTDLSRPPAEIFEWMQSHEGEQVIAVNHAAGGYFSGMQIDLLRGTSKRKAASSRLAEIEGSSEEDTGFWSEGFTAMEIYNGYNLGAFNELFRAWLTLVGRGFTPTATAVSDTHKVYNTLAGAPRSWIYVGENVLTRDGDLSSLDQAAFVSAVNQGKLIGSNGPLLMISAEHEGQTVGIGDTLDLSAVESGENRQSVHVKVLVRCPDWMSMTTAHLYVNIKDGLDLGAGNFDESEVPPSYTMALRLKADDEDQGPLHEKERVYEAIFDIDITEDSYIVSTVIGDSSAYPVIRQSSVTPFAYSNPMYVDTDGEGYNQYPLTELLIADGPMEKRSVNRYRQQWDYLHCQSSMLPMNNDLDCLWSSANPYYIASPRPDEDAISHLLHYLNHTHE